ncbi:MAG: ATP-binding protein [Bacteroidetes bacterium]|nr:ATP-binding protein [Bacteroidota bacterium]
MQKTTYDIIIFLVVISAVILGMVAFIVFILFLYRRKQQTFEQQLEKVKLDNERILLSTQLEIQEQTFQNISREIHDNITLSLTLAKLHLHTLDPKDPDAAAEKVHTSIELLTKSITELSDISKGLNADVIIQHGLLKALEEEIQRIRQTGLFTLAFEVEGTPVYMDNQQELIIFRIIQESFNNIIKHAGATHARLLMHYHPQELVISIQDNGRGFDTGMAKQSTRAGLKNMETRVRILNGTLQIQTAPAQGTTLIFTIPIIHHANTVN